LIVARVTKYAAFVFVPKLQVYNEKLVVFPENKYEVFSILQSILHEAWVWQQSSTLGTGLNYAPSDCFETFPFPKTSTQCEKVGSTYHEYRHQLMLERQEGLTATYNRFHDPQETAADITHLRQLHVEMDNAVAAAYGWQDLDLGHGYHETAQGIRYTVSEPARRELLTRLLKLNHERYAEEVRLGLHEKKQRGKGTAEQKGGRGKAKKSDGQMPLL
jgi:hypothetical protein